MGSCTISCLLKAYYPYYTVRVQKVWKDYVTIPYWDIAVTNHTVNGAVVAQTFLNSQDGWLCGVNLYFSQVAATGNVTVLITELTNGSPDFNSVLGASTVNVLDLRLAAKGANPAPTDFPFLPIYLAKARYAIVVISAGNHFLWQRQDTNVVSGTYFTSTDGAWWQGELAKDMAFELQYCRFVNVQTLPDNTQIITGISQTQVVLRSLQLQNGIAAIAIGSHQFIPDGCQLIFEIQVNGVWYSMEAGVGGGPDVVLIGLPPTLPFRVRFVGTEWLMPALGVASNSRVVTSRPRPDMTFISAIRNTGTNVVTISADVRLEAWRGNPIHTFSARLLHGGGYSTIRIPDNTSVETAPDDPNAVIYHFTWTGMGAISTFRFKYTGATQNVLTCFHIAEHIDIDIP